MPNFGATNLQCAAGADNFAKDCTFTEYPNKAAVPCFNGDELEVQCTTDEEWEFKYTNMISIIKKGPRGRAKCTLLAERYGVQIDVKRILYAMLVNVRDSGVVEIVDKEMKYRKGKRAQLSRFGGYA